MSILAVARTYYTLPDTPYNLWMRDELATAMDLPNDGTRVEIIGGEIVVSPTPLFEHNAVVWEIQKGLHAAQIAQPDFSWECVTGQDLALSDLHSGYIPDLCVLPRDAYVNAMRDKVRKLRPEHLELVVEVTSPTNAPTDRRSGPRRTAPTKWHEYARVGVPFYLLVDRDPKVATVTLFSEPDRAAGEYGDAIEWKFGEKVELPAPLGFSFATDEWDTWN
ncbi:Uma2 family endonuclease [Actinomadura rayongensis]|uniref:Putative restriction endonuclease domain-containing protein n=1 Tax=Actinomadura rayongensis TaxID=1429076 RepID=A0A6I4W964_9ACTN|nr:hypothetical protein [Actinomadura rayongensis]